MLADQTKVDAKKIEELRRSEILKAGRVFTISDFTSKAESDIEDLFEPELFVSIVNATYTLPEAQVLTAQSLEDADKNAVRLVKKAEAAFNLMPEPIPTFDHFTPSAWLVGNLNVLEGVRRQSFWDRERLKIRESLARLVFNVMRPADGAASGDWRLSFV